MHKFIKKKSFKALDSLKYINWAQEGKEPNKSTENYRNINNTNGI